MWAGNRDNDWGNSNSILYDHKKRCYHWAYGEIQPGQNNTLSASMFVLRKVIKKW